MLPLVSKNDWRLSWRKLWGLKCARIPPSDLVRSFFVLLISWRMSSLVSEFGETIPCFPSFQRHKFIFPSKTYLFDFSNDWLAFLRAKINFSRWLLRFGSNVHILENASPCSSHLWLLFRDLMNFWFSFSPYWRFFSHKIINQKCGVKKTVYKWKFIPAFMG